MTPFLLTKETQACRAFIRNLSCLARADISSKLVRQVGSLAVHLDDESDSSSSESGEEESGSAAPGAGDVDDEDDIEYGDGYQGPRRAAPPKVSDPPYSLCRVCPSSRITRGITVALHLPVFRFVPILTQ
jgi:hypothetical protein